MELNPGPVRYPCSSCFKPVAKSHKSIECDSCSLWAHIGCEKISNEEYKKLMKKDSFCFICTPCHLKELPFPEGITSSEQQSTSTQKEFKFEDVAAIISNSRGLKIAHLNTNGLLSKLDFLRIMLQEAKFDIFCISESKLDANIHDNEIKIDGYDLYCLDCNRHGGGVLLYINNRYGKSPFKTPR